MYSFVYFERKERDVPYVNVLGRWWGRIKLAVYLGIYPFTDCRHIASYRQCSVTIYVDVSLMLESVTSGGLHECESQNARCFG